MAGHVEQCSSTLKVHLQNPEMMLKLTPPPRRDSDLINFGGTYIFLKAP